jgi:hypothetical protein
MNESLKFIRNYYVFIYGLDQPVNSNRSFISINADLVVYDYRALSTMPPEVHEIPV